MLHSPYSLPYQCVAFPLLIRVLYSPPPPPPLPYSLGCCIPPPPPSPTHQGVVFPPTHQGVVFPLLIRVLYSPHSYRLVEVKLHVPQGCGLGISIVGGTGSPTGDLPVVIKRILPQGLAAKDGRLKMGDQLVAINERLLVGVSKTYALNALSNLKGHVRLLVLQDY